MPEGMLPAKTYTPKVADTESHRSQLPAGGIYDILAVSTAWGV